MVNARRREENAEYIAAMCDELAGIAEESGFDVGSALLRMAVLEFTEQFRLLETSSPAPCD